MGVFFSPATTVHRQPPAPISPHQPNHPEAERAKSGEREGRGKMDVRWKRNETKTLRLNHHQCNM
ncbi:hypothetical protein B0T17DRAFT_529224 [Bombardia bombarda]|uniref:Uncharacterized protein n=1 Tax=Bombardia bombarda TaxID=252184 RepID=A0AA40CAS2_9PEZI|nr:hypothetical protein B0T17DRAFT_529224 [Bombardia bombarda]